MHWCVSGPVDLLVDADIFSCRRGVRVWGVLGALCQPLFAGAGTAAIDIKGAGWFPRKKPFLSLVCLQRFASDTFLLCTPVPVTVGLGGWSHPLQDMLPEPVTFYQGPRAM